MRGIKWNFWLRQLAVVVGYAAAYVLARSHSDGIWSIVTGLRLAWLLLLPTRYWAALAIGELIPLTVANVQCLIPFGPTWVILSSIPPVLLAMPIVWWFRSRMDLFPSKRTVQISPLIFCVVTLSVFWTLVVFAIALTADVPVHLKAIKFAYGIVGKYAGILTIIPLALMIRLTDGKWMDQLHWSRLVKSPLILDTCLIVLPMLICLSLVTHHASVDTRQIIHIAFFVPVAWLTIKYGWRAAAIGTAIVMTCIFFDLQSHPDDVDLVQLQAFVAFASTCLIALGANITTQHQIEDRERIDAKQAVRVAQHGLYLSEVRMRQTAQALEQVGGALQLTQNQLLTRFKHLLPTSESQSFHKQATATRDQVYRLADSMHPFAWRDKGLPAALRETIARILDEAGIGYRCDFDGRELSQLASGVHTAIYRLICEAVVYACDLNHCTSVHLQLRGGHTHGERWAVMRLTGTHASTHACINDSIYRTDERQAMARKLGAHGLDLNAMRDFVRVYNGELHMRTAPEHIRITALFHDAEKGRQRIDAATPKMLLLR
ncbi:MAG: MASE1 domain-containing protein [Rhodanobacter sp.]